MANRVKLPVVQTMAAIAAYCWLTKPDDKFNKDKPKYKVTLVVDDDEAAAELIKKIKTEGQATALEMGYKKVAKSKDVKIPVDDGTELNDAREADDKERIEAFEGKKLLRFSSQYQPKLFIPRALQEEYAEHDREVWIMSGDIVKVKAEVLPYDGFGGGLSLRLKAVKLVEKMAGLDDGGFGDDDDDEYVASKPSSRSKSSDSDDDDDEDDY